MTKRVLLPLAKGFEETEAIAIVDVLRRAEVEVVLAGLEDGPVESAHAVTIVPDATLATVAEQRFDAIVLPGGLEGTERLAASELVGSILERMGAEGTITAAICAAPTVFEKQGMLKGRRATCHFSMQPKLKSAEFVEEAVVIDGKVVTSRGVGTALDLGLELVEQLVDAERAKAIAKAIHYER